MNKNKKSKKKVLIIIFFAFIIAISSAFFFIKQSKMAVPENNELTETFPVKRQNLVNSINVVGNTKSSNICIVTGATDIRIQTVNVNLGDNVKKGDIICIYDDTALLKEYETLQASLNLKNEINQSSHNINQRNLESARSERETLLSEALQNVNDAISARDNAYQKYEDLKTQRDNKYNEKETFYSFLTTIEDELQYSLESQKYQELLQEIQKIETEISTIESQLNSYDDNVKSMQNTYSDVDRSTRSNIQNIQDTIDNEKFDDSSDITRQIDEISEKIESCKVIAPQDGVITTLNIMEGCVPTTDVLAIIESDEDLVVEVQIKDADILSIKKGMKTIIKTDATGDEEFYGTVSKIINVLNSSNISTNEASYSAEIILDNKYSELLLGMKTKVKIIVEEKNDVIAVPYDAITRNNEGQSIIYVANQQSDNRYIAKAISVETGLVSDYYTEISSNEINVDDMLIVNIDNLYDGKEIYIKSGDAND